MIRERHYQTTRWIKKPFLEMKLFPAIDNVGEDSQDALLAKHNFNLCSVLILKAVISMYFKLDLVT